MSSLRTPWQLVGPRSPNGLYGAGTQLKGQGGLLIADLQNLAFQVRKIAPLLRDAPEIERDRNIAIRLLTKMPKRSDTAKRWAGWEKERDAFLKRIERKRT